MSLNFCNPTTVSKVAMSHPVCKISYHSPRSQWCCCLNAFNLTWRSQFGSACRLRRRRLTPKMATTIAQRRLKMRMTRANARKPATMAKKMSMEDGMPGSQELIC